MRAEEIKPNKLVIFDIDDTLVKTDTKVNVVKDGKVIKRLNSHDEYYCFAVITSSSNRFINSSG